MSASSRASPASRPYTLTDERADVVAALELHHSFPLDRRRGQIVHDDPEFAEREDDPRIGRPPAGRARGPRERSAAARMPSATAADAPEGSAAPIMIAPTNCRPMSQSAKLRNGCVRCGDAVDITAVAMTTSIGGNTGGPSMSKARSATAVPSVMTIAATAAAPAVPTIAARTRSRVNAKRPRDDRDDDERQRPRHRHPEHQPPQGVEKSRNVGHRLPTAPVRYRRTGAPPTPASNTTRALMMVTTTSVGRRARGSSCADANSCRPPRGSRSRGMRRVDRAGCLADSLRRRRCRSIGVHWRSLSTVGWARSATISAMPWERKRVIASRAMT